MEQHDEKYDLFPPATQAGKDIQMPQREEKQDHRVQSFEEKEKACRSRAEKGRFVNRPYVHKEKPADEIAGSKKSSDTRNHGKRESLRMEQPRRKGKSRRKQSKKQVANLLYEKACGWQSFEEKEKACRSRAEKGRFVNRPYVHREKPADEIAGSKKSRDTRNHGKRESLRME